MPEIFRKGKDLALSQTAKDTYWVLGGNVVSSFFAFIYTIFLARVFNPSVFGIFNAVIAFITMSGDVLELGIGSALSRFIPAVLVKNQQVKAKQIAKTAFLFQFRVGFIFSLIVLLLSPFLSWLLLNDSSFSFLFILAALGIFGSVIFAFSIFLLSAQKKFISVTLLNTSNTILKTILIIILFYLNQLTLTLAVVIFMLTPFVGYLMSLKTKMLKFYNAKPGKGMLQKILSFSLFLAVAKVFSAVAGRLDALMLIPLSSAYEAGIYSGAFKIVQFYTLFIGSFGSVISPRLSSFTSLNQSMGYLLKVFVVVLLMVCSMLVMYLIAPWFVIFVLGDQYQGSVAVFQALLIPMALFMLRIPPTNFLIYTLHKPHVSTFNTFVQLLLIVLGNFWFIPRIGRFGPVWTLIIADGFTLISSYLFFFHYYFKAKSKSLS